MTTCKLDYGVIVERWGDLAQYEAPRPSENARRLRELPFNLKRLLGRVRLGKAIALRDARRIAEALEIDPKVLILPSPAQALLELRRREDLEARQNELRKTLRKRYAQRTQL